ncbi:hypothetical protein L0244_25660 [bacterium]|nr:hypothetical protein [bacterium]MCI0693266.1 hypothetical protein [candidate division KSB1 bacterium]
MQRKVQKSVLIIFILTVSFLQIKCPPPNAIYQVTGNKDTIIGTTMGKILIWDANDLKLISFFKDKLTTLPVFVTDKKVYYLTGGKRQLSILDISNSQIPRLIEQVKYYKNIDRFKIINNYVYLTIKNRLIIVDSHNMQNILTEYQTKTLDSIWDLGTDEQNHLYLSGRDKLEILDISNMASPRYLQTFEYSDVIRRLDICNNTLYLHVDSSIEMFSFDELRGLISINKYSDEDIINLQSFEDPILVKSFYSKRLHPYFGALSISINDVYVYISKGTTIEKMDISDPYNPRVVASYVNK